MSSSGLPPRAMSAPPVHDGSYKWLAFTAIGVAFVLYALRQISAFTMLFGLSLFIVGALFFVLGVVLKQGNIIQRELWLMQRARLKPGSGAREPVNRTSDSEETHPHV